jgi:hypothetical protein
MRTLMEVSMVVPTKVSSVGVHQLIHKTAVGKCKQQFKEHPTQWIGGLAGCLVLFVIFGETAMMQQVYYGVAGTLVILLGSYLWHSIKATTEIHNNLTKKHDDLEAENKALKDPCFEFQYSSSNLSCYQKGKWLLDGDVIESQLCRFAIVNKNIPQSISVEVTDIAPCPRAMESRLPLPLQFQHYAKTSREISLKANDCKYVDVVQRTNQGGAVRLTLQHIIDNVSHELEEDRKYEITVTVRGDKGSSQCLLMVYCEYGQLFMLMSS